MPNMELEVKLYRMMCGLVRQMADEIAADDFCRLPEGGGNSPNWILGHLSVVNMMGLATLGRPVEGFKQMLPLYGPGSTPAEDPSTVPSKDQLLARFQETSEQLVEAIAAASPEQLDAARDGAILKEQLPTVRDILGHILTTHIGLHAGQLSAWRRGRGMAPVLQMPS